MEQIYYTQCPMGYGLGASNGFQVKRLSPGYPMTGDFRHLGMRAFLAGTRDLAPPVLRYRRDGDIAEIAWLTPRPQEYETERGLWGRPGGHFAHGLRLAPDELAALANWPAGLFGGPFWRRSDPEPSRGRPPEDRALGPDDLLAPPTFAGVAPRAAGEDPGRLARLLTALAAAAREGRTLFLIDDAGRLGDWAALLTFAFPAALRGALTFSTYHDRPEELPGLRLQGTVPAARPNRAVLASLGIVADLTAGAFEPRVEPAAWAQALAGWLVRGGRDDEAAWSKTEARAARMRLPTPESAWSDEWLDRLFAFHDGCRVPAAVPDRPEGWARLADLTTWAGRAGLADEWLVRGPTWWRDAASPAAAVPEARAALVAHGANREAWSGPRSQPAAWGAVAARWLAEAPAEERFAAVVAFLRGATPAARLPFLNAALDALPPAAAEDVLGRLRSGRVLDPALLMPLEVRPAVAAALDGHDAAPLRDLLARALASPAVRDAVLEALGQSARPEGLGTLASVAADVLDLVDPAHADAFRAWALPRDDAEGWLGPHLRRRLALPDDNTGWRLLRDGTPEPLRPMLALAALGVAGHESIPPGAFRWAVEELLLPLEPGRRPHDPAWPDAYLDRAGSSLDLIRRLYARDRRHPELRRWLAAARQRGEIGPRNAGRLDRCERLAQALASGRSDALLGLELPDVPPAERGTLLAQLVARLGQGTDDGLRACLESCRHAWPDAFAPGAAGLDGLARPVAEALRPDLASPAAWLARLEEILGWLDLKGPGGAGFEPNSLAAEVVAASTGQAEAPRVAWALRQALFDRDDAWRALAADARQALRASPGRYGPAALNDWDVHLVKGRKTARFYELMLNACDGPTLAAVAGDEDVQGQLRTLGPLPWWAHDAHPGASDDLRDALARTAPMAPLPEDTFQLVRHWMGRGDRPASSARGVEVESLDPLFRDAGELPPDAPLRPASGPLSYFGQLRWRCLEALTVYARAGNSPGDRWRAARSWEADALPLGQVDEDDRHRFLARVVLGLEDEPDAPVERLAYWLYHGAGVRDADRLRSWADEAGGDEPVPLALQAARAELVHRLGRELRALAADAGGAGRRRRKEGPRDSPGPV